MIIFFIYFHYSNIIIVSRGDAVIVYTLIILHTDCNYYE